MDASMKRRIDFVTKAKLTSKENMSSVCYTFQEIFYCK